MKTKEEEKKNTVGVIERRGGCRISDGLSIPPRWERRGITAPIHGPNPARSHTCVNIHAKKEDVQAHMEPMGRY